MIHPSHDTLDVSDLSIYVDVACRNCHLLDEALSEPCTNLLKKPKSDGLTAIGWIPTKDGVIVRPQGTRYRKNFNMPPRIYRSEKRAAAQGNGAVQVYIKED